MNRDTLEKRVKELMVDKTKVEKISQIDNTAPISEYFNSISYIQFVIAVEDEFDLDFEDEILDAANFKNLNDVINILLDIIQKNDLEQ
ncbi:MAG: phosphopantetheine-binding protein [Clostridia bacterium]|jgi:acyl carrier protein|nr:phosphopantetheine-binding protein [Clostridia bacterium]MDD3092594.1 phosphopantetheine-binding protein [Clostridia bacterium]MDD3970580.1 phosphopantetheine-binding protein [Clostridia bacterium]